MSLAALAPFVGSLCDSRLLEPEQQRELLGSLQTRFPEPRALAGELIRRGWLTPYQVNQIAQGRAAALSMDQFVILERLGEGGMGQVFKARQRSLGRIVAVKIIRPEQTANTTAVRRFRREAEVAAHLDHPNIVHVLDAGESKGTCYLAMEYVEGRDLAQILASVGAVTAPLACEYIRQAALGLHHAHAKGMVHRDVKPSNLLVASGAKPIVKLLDLGLARLRALHQDEASISSVTQAGVVVGTLDYMAPEQAKNAHGADARADLYSLGCTLYHLLAGRPPFASGTGMEKLLQHQLDTPSPIEKLCPNLPPKVAQLIARLLAKKPEQRPTSAAEVAETLQPYCDAAVPLPTTRIATPVEVEPTLQLPAPVPDVASKAASPSRSQRRRPWLVAVAAVGAALLLLFVVAVAIRAVSQRNPAPIAATAPTLEPMTWRLLERHLPDDSIFVLRLAPRQVRATGPLDERLKRDTRDLLQANGGAEWAKAYLGLDWSSDLERALLVQPYRDPNRPLLLLAGTIDRSKFRMGEGGLRPVEGASKPRYELPGDAKRSAVHLALLREDLLGITLDPELLDETIAKAAGTRTTELKAPKMAEFLLLADDSRPISLAGVGASVASWPFFNDKPEIVRSLVKQWGFFGSVSIAEDAEADLVCRPIAENASPEALGTLLETTRRLVGLQLRVQEAFRQEPAIHAKLLEKAVVTRKGDDVVLHSRVTAADLTVRPRFKKPNAGETP